MKYYLPNKQLNRTTVFTSFKEQVFQKIVHKEPKNQIKFNMTESYMAVSDYKFGFYSSFKDIPWHEKHHQKIRRLFCGRYQRLKAIKNNQNSANQKIDLMKTIKLQQDYEPPIYGQIEQSYTHKLSSIHQILNRQYQCEASSKLLLSFEPYHQQIRKQVEQKNTNQRDRMETIGIIHNTISKETNVSDNNQVLIKDKVIAVVNQGDILSQSISKQNRQLQKHNPFLSNTVNKNLNLEEIIGKSNQKLFQNINCEPFNCLAIAQNYWTFPKCNQQIKKENLVIQDNHLNIGNHYINTNMQTNNKTTSAISDYNFKTIQTNNFISPGKSSYFNHQTNNTSTSNNFNSIKDDQVTFISNCTQQQKQACLTLFSVPANTNNQQGLFGTNPEATVRKCSNNNNRKLKKKAPARVY